MYDVVAVGELLIDFTPAGTSDRGAALFARNPGGAPANVLAAVTRLGGRTAFIGKVGEDGFGRFLRDTLDGLGIDVSGLVMTGEVPTTLAFVQLDEHGDRSFSFYRKPGADIMLSPGEVMRELTGQARIMHFGSVSLTDEPSRSATLAAVRAAKEAGAVVSYDPNYRPLLWESPGEAKRWMREGLSLADIVKVSDEELTLLTGETDLERGSQKLLEAGASLALVSLGAKGAFFRLGELCGRQPTFDVRTVDTNGAGDSFFGAVLYRLCGKSLAEIRSLTREELEDVLSFGNAAGSMTTTRPGAIPALPTMEEVLACRAHTPLLLK